jgi:predicted signal transduction protein with EAL and GGDEF domain
MDKQLFEGCETELVLQDINNKRIIVEVGYSQVVINELHHYIFIFKDITSRKEDEINLKFLAETHYITHLPNRNQAQSQIADKCQRVDADEKLSFIFISFVENNKVVEFYGHERLEYLLLNIALILVELAAINGSALIHWGDNDFLMVEKQSYTKELIDALLVRFDQSVQICDSTEVGIYARPTVGICDSSLLPSLVLQDYDTLVHNALLATFEGARLSRSVTYYDDQLHDKINYQAMIEKELVIAIQEESFRVAYQPKVDLSTGEIVAAEALIRWNHPQFGFIRPDIFIPVAESGGLIKDIGALVLTMVLNDISKIKNKYPGIHHVAINVAAPQLDNDFIVLLQSKLVSHGKGISEFIELEITETSFLDDFDRVSLILQQIKQLGFRLALDDFGTGYSSLSYLHELPVDTLKIDRAFIIPILESKRSLLLVKSIISMSLSLGLEIVAEGIEDKKTGELLNEMGVQQGQGFYYYRPEFL